MSNGVVFSLRMGSFLAVKIAECFNYLCAYSFVDRIKMNTTITTVRAKLRWRNEDINQGQFH